MIISKIEIRITTVTTESMSLMPLSRECWPIAKSTCCTSEDFRLDPSTWVTSLAWWSFSSVPVIPTHHCLLGEEMGAYLPLAYLKKMEVLGLREILHRNNREYLAYKPNMQKN